MRVEPRIGVSLVVCSLAGAAVALDCGGNSGPASASPNGTVATSDNSDATSSDSAADPSNDGAPATTGDDSGPMDIFTSSDAGGPVFPCQPGTYGGAFSTKVTSDAGGLFSLFSLNWKGNLSITLQGRVMSGAGEIPEPTLTIAPGAKLSGTDAYGGTFSAELSGQLDCPSKTLTGTLANGSYNWHGSTMSLDGTLSATYDGTMTPPALTMGGMNVTSPQVPSLAADGTWTAQLQQ
jgi:hypothetical protein